MRPNFDPCVALTLGSKIWAPLIYDESVRLKITMRQSKEEFVAYWTRWSFLMRILRMKGQLAAFRSTPSLSLFSYAFTLALLSYSLVLNHST